MYMDNVNLIKVHRGNDVKELPLHGNESLMEGLLREGYYISAVCGGTGRCGKCKVRILEGNAPVTAEDKKVFSEEEIANGWRLACKLYPQSDLTISVTLEDETSFDVVSDYAGGQQNTLDKHELLSKEVVRCQSENSNKVSEEKCVQKEYDIAIDIGTTTIALQLLDRMSGQVQNTVTAINSQRRYGADVISRIQASVDGKKEDLRETIRKDLQAGIGSLLASCEIAQGQIKRIAIGCNTTMGHLLMGYDCSGLGSYPFTPEHIGFIKSNMSELLGMDGNAEVILLPGISAYVGGDIVSGLYACDFGESEDICLLVDLGTNGEMALGNRSKILVASVAAGPAFEGGNISWGMGSVAGAICSVQLEGAKAQVRTIREKEPVGICGTGVIDTVAELLREKLVDETGLLSEEYFEEGFPLGLTKDGRRIVFTQKDIRELQLAKAAIRAGVEILLQRYGIAKEQVTKIYLAGGFGYKLDTAKAIAIGMLPEEFAERIQAVGNSCLAGTAKYLQDNHGMEALQGLIAVSEEIVLSTDDEFNENYMDSMMF